MALIDSRHRGLGQSSGVQLFLGNLEAYSLATEEMLGRSVRLLRRRDSLPVHRRRLPVRHRVCHAPEERLLMGAVKAWRNRPSVLIAQAR